MSDLGFSVSITCPICHKIVTELDLDKKEADVYFLHKICIKT